MQSAREGIAYHRIEASESNNNAVFILDRRVAIKIYNPFWEQSAFERALIELLVRDPAAPVPAICAAGVLRHRRDWSYLATEFRAERPLDQTAARDDTGDPTGSGSANRPHRPAAARR